VNEEVQEDDESVEVYYFSEGEQTGYQLALVMSAEAHPLNEESVPSEWQQPFSHCKDTYPTRRFTSRRLPHLPKPLSDNLDVDTSIYTKTKRRSSSRPSTRGKKVTRSMVSPPNKRRELNNIQTKSSNKRTTTTVPTQPSNFKEVQKNEFVLQKRIEDLRVLKDALEMNLIDKDHYSKKQAEFLDAFKFKTTM